MLLPLLLRSLSQRGKPRLFDASYPELAFVVRQAVDPQAERLSRPMKGLSAHLELTRKSSRGFHFGLLDHLIQTIQAIWVGGATASCAIHLTL